MRSLGIAEGADNLAGVVDAVSKGMDAAGDLQDRKRVARLGQRELRAPEEHTHQDEGEEVAHRRSFVALCHPRALASLGGVSAAPAWGMPIHLEPRWGACTAS